MKNKAFTLIELLVVVLIIGILAAIALPQYEKAVFKSRASEAAINVKAIWNACEVASLAQGRHCGEVEDIDLSDLDIEVPGEEADWDMGESKNTKYFKYTLQNPGASGVAYYRPNGENENFSLCIAYDSYTQNIICSYIGDEAEKLCKTSGFPAIEESGYCW